MFLKNYKTAIFTSAKGTVYEVKNINGNLECFKMPEHKKRNPTKEMLKKIKLEREEKYLVYTDGGCEYNPGGRGGIGIVITDENGKTIKISGEGYESTTNNRMEVMAAIRALSLIPEAKNVTIYSDSQYLINTINGAYAKRKNLDLWERLDSVMKGKKVIAKWVRGHAGNPTNELCDKIATQSMYSDNLKIDKGYSGGKAKKKGSMGVDINLPDHKYEIIMSPHKYAELYRVNPQCAVHIIGFVRSDKSFRNYKALKTDGRDHWSGIKGEELFGYFDKEPEIVKQYIEDPKDVEACLRWILRGLDIKDSIRKVLVDREIRENALKNS